MPGLKRMAWAGFALALLAGAGWLLLQTAYFAGTTTPSEILSAVPLVLRDTRFGMVLSGRMAALLLAAVLFQCNRPRLAALLAFGGVVAQAWLGHGAAAGGREGDILLVISILHLAAAALWLGTLPALLLATARLADPTSLARRYFPLGAGCVVALLLTALVQYLLLIGSPAALFTSGYGAVALVKIILLALLIAVAARNRLGLVPALPATRRALLRAIGAEMLLGLFALLAAGILLQMAPPAMMPPQG